MSCAQTFVLPRIWRMSATAVSAMLTVSSPPRYRNTLASGVTEEVCRRVNLGFLDPRAFRREDYETDSDTLVVENAGRDLLPG